MIDDILLNFKNKAYEFYEWEKDDNILHIKSILTFKVKDEVLMDFLSNEIIVSNKFLNEIKNKTEVYGNNNTTLYSCILFNKEISIAFLFNNSGKVIGRSKLLFDEEYDIVKYFSKVKYKDIQYEIKNKILSKKYITRKENYNNNILKKYIDTLYRNKKYDEIKYLYIECFNDRNLDIKEKYNDIIRTIESNNVYFINKILDILKVYKK